MNPNKKDVIKGGTAMEKILETLYENKEQLERKFSDCKCRKYNAEVIWEQAKKEKKTAENVFEQAREALEQAQRKEKKAENMREELITEYYSIEQKIHRVRAYIEELESM